MSYMKGFEKWISSGSVISKPLIIFLNRCCIINGMFSDWKMITRRGLNTVSFPFSKCQPRDKCIADVKGALNLTTPQR